MPLPLEVELRLIPLRCVVVDIDEIHVDGVVEQHLVLCVPEHEVDLQGSVLFSVQRSAHDHQVDEWGVGLFEADG